MKYPITKKENITETLYGQSIEDPYRWLEDFTSDESSAWVEAQNAFSDQKLTNNEFKDKIKSDLETIWVTDTMSMPYVRKVLDRK